MSLILLSLIDRGSEPALVLAPSDYPLHLELPPVPKSTYWLKIILASLAVHAVLFVLAIRLPSFKQQQESEERLIVHRIPLYIPRDVLTQTAPNKKEIAKHVDLAELMNLQDQRARQSSPDRSVRRFEMPKNSSKQATVNTPVSILPSAPSVVTSQTVAPPLPGSINGITAAPPPPTPSTSPFQNIGTEAPPTTNPKIPPPKTTVQAALDGLRQSGNGSHVVITDDSPTQPSLSTPGIVGQQGAQHAGVELKSDPQGIDMRPYLAQILSIVRSNWRRVIPESARQGTLRGRTVLEFIINRDGSIPKLVTAESSGLDPLDRAAIAGLSMSNPLPPLPAGFKGEQVRLAFSFACNMAAE